MIKDIKNFYKFNFKYRKKFIEENFLLFYERNIEPELNDLKLKRRKLLLKFFGLIFLVISSIIAGSFIESGIEDFVNLDTLLNTFLYCLIGILCVCLIFYFPIKGFCKNVKEFLYPKIFKYFGETFHYNYNDEVSIDELLNYDILPEFNDYEFKNFVLGSYKGVDLKFQEAKLEFKEIFQDDKGNKQINVKEVFKGLLLIYDFNKSFTGKTIVIKDKGFILNFLNKKFDGLKNVRLEDPVFEKEFEVFATDQIEARFLLTTNFMERLIKLSKIFNSGEIQCSFYNKKLLIMVGRKFPFIIPIIFKKMDLIAEINIIILQMRTIFTIIDELKLKKFN